MGRVGDASTTEPEANARIVVAVPFVSTTDSEPNARNVVAVPFASTTESKAHARNVVAVPFASTTESEANARSAKDRSSNRRSVNPSAQETEKPMHGGG